MKKVATRSQTLALLEAYELQAKKKYGQNFIIDPNIIQKTIDLAELDENTVVIEIGPGLGALTQGLLERAGKVLAYDIDPDVIQVLQQYLSCDKLTLIQKDFLQVDLVHLLAELHGRRVKLVSNLPYYITTDLIEKITLASEGLEQAIIMVQKEVAEKMASPASRKERQPLHYLLDEVAEVRYLMTVPRTVFYPMPHVDSALLGIRYTGRFVDRGFYDFLKLAFKARRKTLYNNIKHVYSSELLQVAYTASQLDLACRAEQLTSVQLKKFYQILTSAMDGHKLG